jgi:hypothetical protein
MNPFGSVTGSLLVVNLVDAWLYGSLLAAVAVALTLVFGLGRVVNFAIGAFYALGAYVAYSLAGAVGYWVAIVLAAICVAVFAGGIERVAIRPLRGRTEISTLLATFGLAILLDGLMQVIWGTSTRTMSAPIGGTVPVDGQLTVAERGVHSVIGPNGAGKTTLFNCIAGEVRPDEGRVTLAGRDITGLAVVRRVRLGLVRTFQVSRVFGSVSARENVCLALRKTRLKGGLGPGRAAPDRRTLR